MSRFHRRTVVVALLTLMPFLWAATGCQSAGAKKEPQTSTTSSGQGPADTMAQSDAERAKAAIDRDQQAQSGERRPYTPPPGPVVNQPPSGGRR